MTDNKPPRILVIAPHADDETLGMGGTIAKKRAAGAEVEVAVLTGHGEGRHPLFAQDGFDRVRAEAAEAMERLGGATLAFRDLAAVTLDHMPVYTINRVVAEVIADASPDEIYFPFYHDLHRDHQALSYAVLVAVRGYLDQAKSVRRLAMYEIPTETHLMPGSVAPGFLPNMFVDIGDHVEAKLAAWSCYKSQQQNGITPRHPDNLRALARLRGSEIGVAHAEAFIIVRERA